jgi:hypothetical protein
MSTVRTNGVYEDRLSISISKQFGNGKWFGMERGILIWKWKWKSLEQNQSHNVGLPLRTGGTDVLRT